MSGRSLGRYEDDERIVRYEVERSKYDDERSRYDDDRSRYDDERSRYDDERSRYDDDRIRYDDERSRYDDVRIRYDDDRSSDEYRSRRRREDSYGSREDSNGQKPILQFTTDINPAIFSGPIPIGLSPPGTSSRYSGYRSDSYSSREDHERKIRRESSSYRDDEDDRRSRRHERDRYERERDYERGRERSRDRDRSREHVRDRSYEPDDERERREREERRDRERIVSRERGDWREEIPNCTLMVRGLDTSVTENEIKEEVMRFGLQPKDIRLIREKGTGASRGFAFVEFQLLSEAVRWKELTKGTVMFRGSNRASLHYSIPKEMLAADRYLLNKADWDCPKCGMSNFKRRDYCFKCNSAREDFDYPHGDCYSEISATPSNTLLFGNLDVLTTEGRVLAMLGQLTNLPIKSLRVAKDSLTNTSRGYAFVELNSTSEAIQLYELLISMGGNFYVDGRQVTVSYAKRNLAAKNSTGNVNAASVALAAAQWTNQKSDEPSNDPYHGVKSSSVSNSSQESSVPNKSNLANMGTVVVNGVTYYKYPPPDISTYQYEASSGFYYDASTGLYYDANSQYYYNSESQQYLYWDGARQTYLPVPQTTSTAQSTETASAATISSPPTPATTAQTTAANATPATTEAEDSDKNKKKEEKLDKVKIAKKIAKDMEKWAKTLNQKKENAKLGIVTAPPIAAVPNVLVSNEASRHSATADAGFAILEKRTSLAERSALMAELDMKFSTSATKPALVSYGEDSDSDTDLDSSQLDLKKPQGNKFDESKYIDLSKKACLLCKRQFPNQDVLTKHIQLSDLHKKNLAKMMGNT